MNLGTIGTSWITSDFIEAAKEQGSLKLQAVYSRSEQKAKEFAEKHGAAGYFTNLREMATSDSIDCVYIASPNSLHFEQVMLFLKHNKHVICEKPMFSNRKEMKKAYQIAEENDVFLFEAMRNIHMPKFQALKENLHHAGKLRSAVLNYSKYSSRYNNVIKGEEPNIFSLNFSGGVLVDLGVYPLAAAIALFGKPEQAAYSPVIIDTGVDGSGTLVLRYPSFTCTILCSKITTSYNPSEIHGETGTFMIDSMGSFSKVVQKNIHSLEEIEVGESQDKLDMFYEIQEFVRIIEKNDKEKYDVLRKISAEVLEITEKVRKENGIIFAAD
ncbi:oxidoreductase [Virgibacillus indicus]|uniref:Oxidoreductase n=1 Tax=Virgibacillus indicus TaxID=2024554 RepID=A0A265N9V9_9BACI|nr:Gfo/Idh/MocA family oxidoreductase [Virgibacillus indicus]OZU88096.1 oxidoreductase [Virgibacillus indicus]